MKTNLHVVKAIRFLGMATFVTLLTLAGGVGQAHAAFNGTINLNKAGSTPDGGDTDDATPVTPGQTLSFTTAYHADGTSGGNKVITFVLIDIDNSTYEPGSISVAGSATPVTQINDGRTSGPNDTAVPPDRSDPESEIDPYNNCPKVLTVSGFPAPPFTFSCDPDVNDATPGQGKSIFWERNKDTVSTPHTVTYKFNFKIRENLAGNHKICIRSFIALHDIRDGTRNRSDQLCYKISVTNVSGTVISDPEEATGKGLRIPIYVSHTCGGGPEEPGWPKAIIPDANGDYDFDEATGNGFCIRAPATVNFEGTDYVLQTPVLSPKVTPNPQLDSYEHQVAGVYCLGNSGLPRNECGPNGSIQRSYDRVEDDEFDFVYSPVPQPPDPHKTGSPAGDLFPANNPACIASRDNAGCRVDYVMKMDNIRDGNFFETEFEDNIPLNLKDDAANVVIDSITLEDSTSGYKPAGWTTNGFTLDGSTCLVGVQIEFPFSFGYGGNSDQSQYSCAFFPANGSVPASIRVHFDVMPAYSMLTVRWHGYTKEATHIGVYPSGPPYCGSDGGGIGIINVDTDGGYNAPGPFFNCEDHILGLQGVSNFATATVDGFTANPVPSEVIYNPIPGDIASVEKLVRTEGDVDADGNGIQEFDTDDPRFDEGDYTINVLPDTGKGPIEYQVIDQDNHAIDFNANPLDPFMGVEYCFGATPNTPPNQCADSGIKWDLLDWPFNPNPGSFFFKAQYKPGTVLGQRINNQAKVCWQKLWEVGHNPACLPTNTVQVERANINEPYFGVQKGGVRAGGNYIAASDGICLTTDHGGFDANNGSYGQYIVSAAGNIADVKSLIDIKDQGGQQCRPNIAAEVDKYMARGGTYHTTMPTNDITAANGPGINAMGYPAGGTSQVVEPQNTFGDVTIDDLTVTKRWTLYVHGDLYIKGNIKNDPNPALISGQPSLGIVVDGNVYVENDVTTIDALIFAKGNINTCSLGAGRSIQQPKTTGYNSVDCKTPLKVNGALMGKSIRFTRTTQRVVGSPSEAEVVELIGQAYVLPPPGFTNLLNPTSGGVVREKQPRF